MAGTAIFDLDRTITRKPTWARFLLSVGGRRPRFWVGLPFYVLHALAHELGWSSREAVKAHALRLLSWCERSELGKLADAFVAADIANGLRPGARSAIEIHRARGDGLLMATAAVDLLAERYGAALGFDVVIATALVWPACAAGSRPRLASANCFGAEKIRRIMEHDGQQALARPVVVYSDHFSDLALLQWADRGVAVNPSRRLRNAAADAGIEIVDFDAMPLYPPTSQASRK